MSQSYLLVGRVSKIQTFIAQSARLRQVIGASYLIDVFGKEIQAIYGKRCQISGGGHFQIVFDSRTEAETEKAHIHTKFRQDVGGGVIHFAIVRDDEFAVENIRKQLGQSLNPASPLWHSPYHAICVSCGVENAIKHDPQHGYICANCQKKERQSTHRQDLFKQILKALRCNYDNVHLPAEKMTEADYYAWDDRQYVAYMVADGNSMGEIFGALDDSGKKKVSGQLSDIVSESLAEAIIKMLPYNPHNQGSYLELPILPLIIGGDDIFVLMPARWALDVAKRFAASYEWRMTELLHDKGLNIRATIGVAVVVAKSSYPYKNIFKHGHDILEEAKDHAKDLLKGLGDTRLAPAADILYETAPAAATSIDYTPYRSAVIMDWLVGSATQSEIDPVVFNLAEAQWALEQRFTLRDLPNKVRHQFRENLFDPDAREVFLKNVRRASKQQHHLMTQAMESGLAVDQLRQLLHCWDFMYDLDRPPEKYDVEVLV